MTGTPLSDARDMQRRLAALRQGDAPLPLTMGQANAQAVRLRTKHGLSYNTLARVMGEYHGVWIGRDAWQKRCRRAGVPASPHGRPYFGAEQS